MKYSVELEPKLNIAGMLERLMVLVDSDPYQGARSVLCACEFVTSTSLPLA